MMNSTNSSTINKKMLSDSPEAKPEAITGLLMILGVVLRVVIAVYATAGQWDWIAERIEVTTPVSSYLRLKECVYLYTHGIPPYEGCVCHQAPLVVALYQQIPQTIARFVPILADCLIAWLLVRIAEYKKESQAGEVWPEPVEAQEGEGETLPPWDEYKHGVSVVERIAVDSTKPFDAPIVASDIGLIHLFNPYAILTCFSQSSQVFSSLAVMFGIYSATQGRLTAAVFGVAFATYLSLYPVMMLVPIILIISSTTDKPVGWLAFRATLVFVFIASILLVASYVVVGDWSFIRSTYGVILFVDDLTPNIGLYWYFFIEIFEQFRSFFIAVFQISAIIFTVPLSLLFRAKPLFVTALLMALSSIFKSYPSVADVAIYLPMLALFPEVFRYAKHSFFALNCMIYATVLGPLFYNLWVLAGAGNANFFYAITLLFSLAQIILVVDLLFGMLLREWERTHPGWRLLRVELIQK